MGTSQKRKAEQPVNLWKKKICSTLLVFYKMEEKAKLN